MKTAGGRPWLFAGCGCLIASLRSAAHFISRGDGKRGKPARINGVDDDGQRIAISGAFALIKERPRTSVLSIGDEVEVRGCADHGGACWIYQTSLFRCIRLYKGESVGEENDRLATGQLAHAVNDRAESCD